MSMQTFYVGIKGVIIRDDKVLLLRANGGKGRRDIWEAPGGRIDGDETMQQTLERELHEELANITDIRIGGILHATRLPWIIDGTNSLTLVFFRVSAEFDGDPVISDEHTDWQWCTLEQARELANEITLPAIEAAFRQSA
jgi:8-oxo-dGTP pyrophosphatase MutT (NUDIX family)